MIQSPSNHLITYSSGTCLCSCEEKFRLRYEEGLKPLADDIGARWIGSAMHAGLEAYIKHGLDAALESIKAIEESTPGIGDMVFKTVEGAAKARAMVRAAAIKWPSTAFSLVEHKVNMEIQNPETSGSSRSFVYAGKVDGVVGEALIDWKSVSDPARYIQEKTIGHQLECYALALFEEGVQVNSVQFRLIKRPTLQLSSIPVLDTDGQKVVLDVQGARVFKKDGKPRQTGDSASGYTVQTRPETGDEFEARCFEQLISEVGFLVEEERFLNVARMEDARRWLWSVSKRILSNRNTGHWLRNEHACWIFNRSCEFLAICQTACAGGDTQQIIDTEFEREETGHVELAEKVVPPAATEQFIANAVERVRSNRETACVA